MDRAILGTFPFPMALGHLGGTTLSWAQPPSSLVSKAEMLASSISSPIAIPSCLTVSRSMYVTYPKNYH